jgi:hypothetical protein
MQIGLSEPGLDTVPEAVYISNLVYGSNRRKVPWKPWTAT